MRTRRLAQHGSPALQAAVAAGLISVFRAGEIAKLHASEQELAVAQWSNRSLYRSQGQRIAANVIRQELGKPKVNLNCTLSLIREAIATSGADFDWKKD